MARPAARRPPDAKGSYANHFEIGYTAFEFVLDFGEAYAGSSPPQCHTRVVTTPVYALALLELLQQSVAGFKAEFGTPEGER